MDASTESHVRRLALRVAVFLVAAVATAGFDLWTKLQPHAVVYHHYNGASPTRFVAFGLALFAFALYRSPLTALGSGLYFGALCGNWGELLRHGYATDWIVVNDRYVTNVADLAVLAGLLVTAVDLLVAVAASRRAPRRRRAVRLSLVFAVACGAVTGVVAHDINIAVIVTILIEMEARLIVWLAGRQGGVPVDARMGAAAPDGHSASGS